MSGLSVIDLSNNPLGDAGSRYLAMGLQRLRPGLLAELYLRHTQIDELGMGAVLGALHPGQFNLLKLHLDGNSLATTAAAQPSANLVLLLTCAQKLEDLSVAHTAADATPFAQLPLGALQRLRKLNLSGLAWREPLFILLAATSPALSLLNMSGGAGDPAWVQQTPPQARAQFLGALLQRGAASPALALEISICSPSSAPSSTNDSATAVLLGDLLPAVRSLVSALAARIRFLRAPSLCLPPSLPPYLPTRLPLPTLARVQVASIGCPNGLVLRSSRLGDAGIIALASALRNSRQPCTALNLDWNLYSSELLDNTAVNVILPSRDVTGQSAAHVRAFVERLAAPAAQAVASGMHAVGPSELVSSGLQLVSPSPTVTFTPDLLAAISLRAASLVALDQLIDSTRLTKLSLTGRWAHSSGDANWDAAAQAQSTGPLLALLFHLSLPTNKTLVYLDVSGNGLRDAGIASLGLALKTNRTLTALRIDENGAATDGLKTIALALKSNKKVRL